MQPDQAPYPQQPGLPPTAPIGGGYGPSLPPKKNNRVLIIIVVVAALLAIAVGATLWLLSSGGKKQPGSNSSQSNNTTTFNPNVTWVPPKLITATTNGIDNSDSTSQIVSFPDSDGCTINTIVAAIGPGADDATAKDAALSFEGVGHSDATISKNVAGPAHTFKDENGQSYQFDSQELEVNAGDGQETVIIAYRAFDNNAVMIDYGCPTAAWADQQENEKLLVDAFTLKVD